MTQIETLERRLRLCEESKREAWAAKDKEVAKDPASPAVAKAFERLTALQKTKANLEHQLKAAKIEAGEQELIITDHAVLRYLERVGGLDVEAIRETIASDEVRALAVELGGQGRGKLEDGTTLTFDRFKLITLF